MTNKRAPYYGFRMESDVLPESRADGRTCAGSRDPPTENPNLIFFFITPRDRLKALPLFTGKTLINTLKRVYSSFQFISTLRRDGRWGGSACGHSAALCSWLRRWRLPRSSGNTV